MVGGGGGDFPLVGWRNLGNSVTDKRSGSTLPIEFARGINGLNKIFNGTRLVRKRCSTLVGKASVKPISPRLLLSGQYEFSGSIVI